MLEKVGLPAKPSMRGGNWVDDASHCQGCSSQFTFFNRKHHCRRCGGLFCNTCTQQRMILRGQGDSPVRICDPCKKLEEAARFELRYGNRNRASKGGSKQALKHEDDILSEILGNDGGKPFSSARQSSPDVVSDLQRAVSSASCSNLDGEAFTPDKKVDTPMSTSSDMQNCVINELGSSSPEELRQQALEEKKKYKILKGEGKSDEALRAFKRGKELERQAAALELALRKSRRKTSTLNNVAATKETNDEAHQSDRKDKLLSQMGKDVKHDLAAELRELGWSDADLHDADKKPAPMSLEGELSTLLRESHKTSAVVGGAAGIDRTEVIALKKKALTFKREGKLAEAKEELKKAKVLEKQLEEQELLGDADDSADELSALILSMDDDGKQDDLKLDYMKDPGFDMGHLASLPDDFASDGNFDVTDDDMNDPEIANALRSFGWAEDANGLNESVAEPAPVDAEALHNEVMSLKKEALNLKRAGNITQAMEQLKKAKLLERDLENSQSASQSGDTPINYFVPNSLQKDVPSQTDAMDDDNVRINKGFDKSPPKSKLAIQKELLGLKKKALALRREGRLDEAEEELKKGKILEHQLEEMENAPKAVVTKGSHEKRKDLEVVHEPFDLMEEEADVTEQDMHDPALLSVLKNLGWEDEEIETMSRQRRSSKEKDGHSEHGRNMRNKPEIPERKLKSKAEIQRELLGIKRKALALKRQGKHEEAEEELRMAKVLEAQMAEMESISQKGLNNNSESFISQDNYESEGTQTKGKVDLGWKENELVQPTFPSYSISVGEASQHNEEIYQAFTKHVDVLPEANESAYVDLLSGNDERTTHSLVKKPANDVTAILPLPNTFSRSETSINLKPGVAQDEVSSSSILNHIDEKREKSVPFVEKTPNHEPNAASGSNYQSSRMSHQQEILAMKKRAVALKREGKLAEAREELRQAKLLEKSLQEEAHNDDTSNVNVSASISNDASVTPESSANQTLKPVSSRDRFKLQQESLAHKRQALKLRREGRIEESEAEFELAKALETQLEEMGAHDPHPNRLKNKVEATDDASVEDLLDPELLSALKGIGLQDVGIVEQAPRKSETHPSVIQNVNISPEKGQLEERIKAEKVQALNLKRAGKQTEALDALRRAKQLEKKLNSLAS